jgi:YesN/AraC family two-component response regulator
MKIKVLLVDDEKLERVLIRKGYDWEANGFEIIGEASSGDEALQLFSINEPHIVLTDINMPFMDGLMLTEKIKERSRNCRVVIVTGYREFEYARKALKLGVKDFILKPMNIQDIANIVEKIKNELKDEEEVNLKNSIKPIYEKNDTIRNRKSNKLIDQTLEYIEIHLYEQSLTLKDIAKKVYSNESYLSRAFKKEMGECLIEYITRKRIEQSIVLLNTTNLKAYEIADQIGIGDPHYFSICFKKQVGVTFKEYKTSNN